MDREDGVGLNPIPRVEILGVGISAIDMRMAVTEIGRWIETGQPHYACITGVHGVMESQRDPELRSIHNQSGLTTPDGMPMVWCARRAGAKWTDRVSGPDLMLEVADVAAREGWTSFFYGGKEGVADLLASKLADRFPGFRTVGTFCPPFRDLTAEESAEVRDRINDAAPQILWVGLSTPKQERWMAANVPLLVTPATLGVGAAFDLNAGLVKRAPYWMQRSGLEWLFRLGTEPRRLWRRYLRNNPEFLMRLMLNPPKLVEAWE